MFGISNRAPRQPHSRPRSARPTAVLRVEALDARDVPAGFFLTGVGGATSPAEPFARLYDASSPGGGSSVVGPGNINAFPGFAGDVRIASGDVNGDGIDDIICAQGKGPGSVSQVKVFNGREALFNNAQVELASFLAYPSTPGASSPGFDGGVFVAAADFNNDGFDELVTSPGAGARGHIKVFNFNSGTRAVPNFLGSNPELRSSFFAYTDFAGEVRVSAWHNGAGGENGLVTGSGAGSTQSDVRLYSSASGNAKSPFDIGEVADGTFVAPARQFFPFPGYTGGLSVATGANDIIFDDDFYVAKNNGQSLVRTFSLQTLLTSTPSPTQEFEAFGGYGGEVRLGAADIDGDGATEVLTSTGEAAGAAGSHIKAWNLEGVPNSVRHGICAGFVWWAGAGSGLPN